jgi:hypothetical protein
MKKTRRKKSCDTVPLSLNDGTAWFLTFSLLLLFQKIPTNQILVVGAK